MAHFAELDKNNIVTQVIVVSNEVLLDSENVEQTALGITFCEELLGGTWVQTSYNANFGGKFATIGDTWDGTNFISPTIPESEITIEPEVTE